MTNAIDDETEDHRARDIITDVRAMLAAARSLIQVVALAAERFGALDRAVIQRLAGNIQSELADADALLEGFARATPGRQALK